MPIGKFPGAPSILTAPETQGAGEKEARILIWVRGALDGHWWAAHRADGGMGSGLCFQMASQ